MSNERDELLDLHGPLLADIREQDDYAVSAVTSISAYSEGVEHALDTVWAKGYRKPRTVTTAEELGAMPVWSVVMSDNTAHQKYDETDGYDWAADGRFYHVSQITLPATVLYEGVTK